MIRSAAFGIDPELQPLREPLLPCLARFVVVDTDDKMAYVTRFQLDDWGIDFSDVYQTALERLANLKHTIEPYGAPHEALWHLIDNDSYESSRLLLPVWRKRVQEALGKRLAFAIPERATLLMAPLDDVAALTRLQEIAAREYAAAPRRLSPDLYAEQAGELRPLELPKDHALTRTLVLRRLQYVVGEYNEQAETLQPPLEDERYVAEAFVFEQDGMLGSMTVWTQDVPSLLPFTDHVGLQGEASQDEPWRLRVCLDDLLREGKHALRRRDEHGLPWLETLRPLDEAELSALRQLSA